MNKIKTSILFLSLLVFTSIHANKKNPAKQTQRVNMTFTENKGQVLGLDGLPHPEVKFYFKGVNQQLFILQSGIAYQFTQVHAPTKDVAARNRTVEKLWQEILRDSSETRTETYRSDLTLVGANPHARMQAEERTSYYENFYNQGVMNVRSYDKITMYDVYPCIDWVIYSLEGSDGYQFKYDFVVHPGGDPSLIKMKYSHFDKLQINSKGNFELLTPLGLISEQSPVSFLNGSAVRTAFTLSDNIVGFSLENYDRSKELVIDPAVSWATYYGGTGYEDGNAVATDASGNVYLVGRTGSSGNIASAGHQNTYGGNTDGFITKFDAAGTRIWSSYYGGNGLDFAYDIQISGADELYIAGTTASSSNISSGGHQNSYSGSSDAFLLKMDAAGSRIWCTYYGGSSTESGSGCAVDNSGDVYLCGSTNSSANIAANSHLSTQSGARNAFLVKFNSSGQRQWATYYGITGSTDGSGCTVDLSGNVYLCGETDYGTDIASGGHQNSNGGTSQFSSDGFLVQFNSSGVRQWGTYYGGDSYDQINACITDAAGDVYVVGGTFSETNISTDGTSHYGASDGFIAKFNTTGTRLWGTYFGGFDQESFYGVAHNPIGGIVAVGYQELSTTDDSFLITGYSDSGQFLWLENFGGSTFDFATGVTLYGEDIYVCGTTNAVSGFANGGFQNNYGGGYDAGLVKFGCYLGSPDISTDKEQYCSGDVINVSANIPAYTYNWHTGAPGSSTQFTADFTTSYTVSYSSSSSCNASTAFQVFVNECTGIKQLSSSAGLSISPNPTSDKLTIVSDKTCAFQLCDMSGKIVLEGVFMPGGNELHLTECRPGVYYLRSEKEVNRVIVMR